MSRLPVPDDDWVESTEGDLDPDLAEESSYDWDPPAHRSMLPAILKVVGALLLATFLASAILPALLR